MKVVSLNNFGGTENFEDSFVNHPDLSAASVRVQIKATAFNPIDYQMRKGGTASKLLKSLVLGRRFFGN